MSRSLPGGRAAHFRDIDDNGPEILTASYDDTHRVECGTDR